MIIQLPRFRFLLGPVLASTAAVAFFAPHLAADSVNSDHADIVIYAASPGGITAAVAAARDGAKVLVLEPTAHVGGIVSQGGLVLSDLGDSSTIGGLSRDFFARVEAHYSTTYGPQSPQREHSKFEGYPSGCFEPRVSEMVYERYLAEQPNIRLRRNVEIRSVEMDGPRIVAFVGVDLADNNAPVRVTGKIFMDATYTGDLFAAAGVPFQVGRESRAMTGEPLARQTADTAIQAYNYRLTLTRDPANLVPVAKPEGYNASDYDYMLEGILRNQPYRITNIFRPYWRLPNQKQDTNVADLAGENHEYPTASPERRREIELRHRNYSLGYIYFLQNDPRIPEPIQTGAREWGLPRDEFPDNGHFPRAIYVREARRMIGEYLMRQPDLQEDRRKPDSIALGSYAIDSHSVKYYSDEQGRRLRDGYLFVPVRPYAIPYRAMLPKREHATNLLVPVKMSSTHLAWASMRMEPVFMMTGEAAGAAAAQALKIGQSLHDLDTDALRARLAAAGALLDPPLDPIAAFTLSPAQPRAGEPVTFTYQPSPGAAEPARYFWDFTGDGQTDSSEARPTHRFSLAKGTLVSLVVQSPDGRRSTPVALRVPVGGVSAGDLQLDSEDPGVTAPATEQSINQLPYWGTMFRHDSNVRKGRAIVTYPFAIEADGTYRVFITSTEPGGRSTKTPVTVRHADGETTVRVNQNTVNNPFGLIPVGDYRFRAGQPATVIISNEGTDNYVIYDVVRLVRLP